MIFDGPTHNMGAVGGLKGLAALPKKGFLMISIRGRNMFIFFNPTGSLTQPKPAQPNSIFGLPNATQPNW
jgi:hypothetical protein